MKRKSKTRTNTRWARLLRDDCAAPKLDSTTIGKPATKYRERGVARLYCGVAAGVALALMAAQRCGAQWAWDESQSGTTVVYGPNAEGWSGDWSWWKTESSGQLFVRATGDYQEDGNVAIWGEHETDAFGIIYGQHGQNDVYSVSASSAEAYGRYNWTGYPGTSSSGSVTLYSSESGSMACGYGIDLNGSGTCYAQSACYGTAYSSACDNDANYPSDFEDGGDVDLGVAGNQTTFTPHLVTSGHSSAYGDVDTYYDFQGNEGPAAWCDYSIYYDGRYMTTAGAPSIWISVRLSVAGGTIVTSDDLETSGGAYADITANNYINVGF